MGSLLIFSNKLDTLYQALVANNFPVVFLDIIYVPIMTIVLLMRYVKQELVFIIFMVTVMALALTGLGFVLTFAALAGHGLGVYQQRYPEEFISRRRGGRMFEGGEEEFAEGTPEENFA